MSAFPQTECPLAVDRIKDPIGLRQFGRRVNSGKVGHLAEWDS